MVGVTNVSFISSYNLLPILTSSTNGDIEAFASSAWSGDYAAWKAFDGVYSSDYCWHTGNGGWSYPQWIGFYNNRKSVVTEIHIFCRPSQPEAVPKVWTLQGSNDAGVWEDIQSYNTPTRNIIVSVDNRKPFYHYRLFIQSTHSDHVAICELKFFGYYINADDTKLFLFNYGDTCNAITGGYTTSGYTLSGYTNAGNISLQGNYISMHPGTSNVVSIFGSVNSFNVTTYRNLRMLYKITANSGSYIRCGLPTVKAEGYNQEFNSQSPGISLNNTILYTWDITSLTGNRYIMLNNHDGGGKTAGEIYQIYLER